MKWIMCLLLLAVLASCQEDQAEVASIEQKKPAPPLEVEVTHLKKGDIWRSASFPGYITAFYNTTIYAKISGYMKYINVDKGDFVTEGEILAEIENPELEAERPRYEAEVAVWGTEYQRLSEALKVARDLVVPLTVDEMRAKYLVAEANLKRINYLLSYARVIAPFSGHITARHVDPGAFIPDARNGGVTSPDFVPSPSAGSVSRSTAIVTMMDFTRVRCDVAVPEMDVPFVNKDVHTTVTAEAFPGRIFDAKVTRYEYALNPTAKTMITEVEIPNPTKELRPGMYIIVKLDLEHKTGVLLAPVSAVIFSKSRSFVFIIDKNSKAKLIPVKTGVNDGTNVEILSGINPAEAVIIPGKPTPKDGQLVAVKGAK